MVGAMCYVDLFADNLQGIRDRIPYLKELGITYLHLMPLFKTPAGDNDGGYAISSYREVDPALGTMEELTQLAMELRQYGISLVIDFVFNHTSDEHEWAKKALAGDPDYQEYYRMYPNRELPDAFETTVNSLFPDEHPGCFTYRNQIRKWIWTTFVESPEKEGDSRWVHRSAFNWELAKQRTDGDCISGRIYLGLLKLISI